MTKLLEDTMSRSVEKIRPYYAERLRRYYTKQDVAITAVLDDKKNFFNKYQDIQLSARDVEIFADDANNGTVRYEYLKHFRCRGRGSIEGEVRAVLVLHDGKILEEYDREVIRLDRSP